uniref:CD109 molecule n=1 Tax=Echeneis naucrates TaxID=173247 RepID=A0A665UQI5_ECHNA
NKRISINMLTYVHTLYIHSMSSFWHPYSLEVKGLVGGTQLFSASKELQFDPKGHTTFIQTDKVNYLPGQVVKIRAVSVHNSVHVLQDPRGNLLRQWLAVDSVLGVVSKEFQLSENPLLGRWTVVSTVSVSLFLVVVSVLPKFEVMIEAPDVIYHKDTLRGSVTAKCDFLTLFVGIVSFISSHLLLNVGGKSDISVNKEKTSFIKSSELVSDALKVKSRGQVVSAGTSSGNLTLAPEASWAPQACVLVYCIRPDGEIVNDVLQLPITQTLRNMVSLSWSDSMRRPADEVTLKVAVAEPPSLVGILVVDKATRRAGRSNDITEKAVRRTAASFLFSLFNSKSRMNEHTLATCVFLWLRTHNNGLNYEQHAVDVLVYSNKIKAHAVRFNWPKVRAGSDSGEGIFSVTNTTNEITNSCFSSVSSLHCSDSDTAEITLTVPDSITTWTASAFVVSQKLGLGVVQTPLTVFQDFFLSLNLPAFIVRGEELLLEVVLFNYLPQNLEVMVIVAESDAFEFVFPDSEQLSMPSVRRVSVGSQSGTSVLVPIRPLVLGEIPIAVKALSSVTSDLVRRTVVVKAEGLEQSFSTSLLFELPPSGLSRVFNFTFPADVVEGSERVSVTAVGDILGPSISGLDSLIQMPHGCGEQNMINFAPNIYVLQYLNATGQARQETADRAKGFMMEGYERELSYQRLDGSFSAFGDHDSSGSSWLTAFVLRCFLQARPFISIDANVLHRAATWLASQQDADGRFEEPGRVIHTELQGGLDGPVSLTAYVLIALLEDGDMREKETLWSKGRLLPDGVPSWSSPDAGLTSSWQPRSADIEMASYLLLAQHKLGRVADGVGLMRWLSQQRNHRGGFGSTQVQIPDSTYPHVINPIIKSRTLFVLFQVEPEEELRLQVTAEGRGLALVQVSGQNVNLSTGHAVWTERTDACDTLNRREIHQSKVFPKLLFKTEFGCCFIWPFHHHHHVSSHWFPFPFPTGGRNKQKCLFSLFSPPQLNVFYNIRNEELARRRRAAGEQPPFHLDIELFDAEMNSAHLHICSR